MKTITLTNGVKVPILGFGTFQITDPQEVIASVCSAIQAGYTHIDTAQSYQNEAAVGEAIKLSGVSRETLFITTKIWVENVSYDGVMTSFAESLERLGLDYVDLLLIHQPYNDVYGAWRAMETLYREGKIRAIGVSNFSLDRVVDLAQFNSITPHVNQIEMNPFHQQVKTSTQLKSEGIHVEAWAPLAEGKNDIFNNPILLEIAGKYTKSVAQIILRWLIEQDVIVLVKSSNPQRMKENIDVFDFALDAEDKFEISKLDLKESQFFAHSDPEIIKMMAQRNLESQ